MTSTLVGVGGGGINIAEGMVEHGFACDRLLFVGRDPRMQGFPEDQRLILELIPEDVVSAQEIVRSIGGIRTQFGNILKQTNLMIFTVGLGGQTGGFAVPTLVGEALAASVEILVIACQPFTFESDERRMYARGQLADLQRLTPNVLLIPNDFLTGSTAKCASIETSFDILNSSLAMFMNRLLAGGAG